MTLISAYNSDGSMGRCDAKCHNAFTPAHTCDCVCGGRNHGVGLKKAMENTKEYVDEWMEAYKEKHPDANFKLHKHFVDHRSNQIDLFSGNE